MKAVLLYVFVAGGVLVSADATARTSKECLAHQIEPAISFVVSNAKTKLNREKSSSQITRFAKSINAFKPTADGRLLGLAYTEIQRKIGVEVERVRLAKNTYCIRLAKVTYTFGGRKSEIFIDRKYKPGSCNYNAILTHEQEHMKINNELQTEYATKIKAALKQRALEIKPFHSTSANRAAKSIANRLTHEMAPLVKEFQKVRRKENHKIDTPESYRQVRGQCSNW